MGRPIEINRSADGVAGLSSRWGAGRPPALNEAQMAELRSLVLVRPSAAT